MNFEESVTKIIGLWAFRVLSGKFVYYHHHHHHHHHQGSTMYNAVKFDEVEFNIATAYAL